MNRAFWRQWHRWIGFVAGAFLLFASVTGVIVAFTEFFGEAEALREATRDLISPVKTDSAAAALDESLRRAVARAMAEAPGAPVDSVVVQFKGPQPTVTFALGRPEGGEDRRMVIDLNSGNLVRWDSYVDKPLIHRIHSGEWFGDGGLVFAMAWGTALALLSASGIVIYFSMRRKNAQGIRRVFW